MMNLQQNYEVLVCKIHSFSHNEQKICTHFYESLYKYNVKFHSCNNFNSWSMKKKSTWTQGEKVDHGYFKSNLMVCKVSSRHPKSRKTSKWSFWTLNMITRWFLQFFWKKVMVKFSQKVVIFRQNLDISGL